MDVRLNSGQKRTTNKSFILFTKKAASIIVAFIPICLLIEGVMVLIFANTNSLGLSIFILVIFSSFVQAAEGSTYGIVPYVDPPSTGSIAGIVGAGGNTGAVCFGLGFRQMAKDAFYLMGFSILDNLS